MKNSPTTLQKQLERSHLYVTILSVLILELLLVAGYLIYLQTDLVASWAGEQAAYIAEDIIWVLEGDSLTPSLAQDFIAGSGQVPMLDESDELEIHSDDIDLLIIFTPDWQVLASNDHRNFYPGDQYAPDRLPGFTGKIFWWNSALTTDSDGWVSAYAAERDYHYGVASIIDDDLEVIGHVYYRAAYIAAPFSSGETFAAFVIVLLGSAGVATLASSLAGRRLARGVSHRLDQLRVTSAALAAGDLDQRVDLKGEDEFAQLGAQFNHMADQIGEQLRQLRDLADHNALLAEEAHALATVEERNRLARELHDAVKQQIFGLSLTAGSIRGLIGKDVELATERIHQLETQARDVHQEMDAIIQQLRPASLGDRGLAAALENLTRKWEDQTQIPVNLRLSGARELPLSIEQALFRITQEALNNVHQHANAEQVDIRLAFELTEVHLQIEDDGQGFDPEAPRSAKSLGLRSMTERAAEIGGGLRVESSEGRGTLIVVQVPL